MTSSLYTIASNKEIASGIYRMTLKGDTSALKRGGQFVDVAIDGFFLRRPLAAQKWDEKEMTIVYKLVGKGTQKMSKMRPGEVLDVLTGLGNGFNADACSQAALVVCGGLGASPAFSLCKELVEKGREVTVILGFNSASDIVLYEDYKSLGVDVRVATMDGSVGVKGLVSDVIDIIEPKFDYFYTCGPKVMMKAVCDKLDVPGEASLEERMGCGCGICYGCTCHTKSGAKRICADGPVFKKEEIVW